MEEDRETLVAVARALTTHIDALKEAVDEQQRTLKQVAIAERTTLIGRMTAGVTHDLRNQPAVLQLPWSGSWNSVTWRSRASGTTRC